MTSADSTGSARRSRRAAPHDAYSPSRRRIGRDYRSSPQRSEAHARATPTLAPHGHEVAHNAAVMPTPVQSADVAAARAARISVISRSKSSALVKDR